jgi:SAM-dependent methyltransferase
VTWERFEREADHYDDWYNTRRGRRASRAETWLLADFLGTLSDARSALEVGCGTGHFTGWLAQRGLRTIGLDRSPSMLAVLRRRHPQCSGILGDAHALPIRDRCVDLVVFVTTLEFLVDPRRALAEAVRVARRGVVVVALNRLSLGALSRRIGPASRGALRSAARDLSPRALRALLADAASDRLIGVRCRSALLPTPFPTRPTSIPVGDVVGALAALRCRGRTDPERDTGGAIESETNTPGFMRAAANTVHAASTSNPARNKEGRRVWSS